MTTFFLNLCQTWPMHTRLLFYLFLCLSIFFFDALSTVVHLKRHYIYAQIARVHFFLLSLLSVSPSVPMLLLFGVTIQYRRALPDYTREASTTSSTSQSFFPLCYVYLSMMIETDTSWWFNEKYRVNQVVCIFLIEILSESLWTYIPKFFFRSRHALDMYFHYYPMELTLWESNWISRTLHWLQTFWYIVNDLDNILSTRSQFKWFSFKLNQ